MLPYTLFTTADSARLSWPGMKNAPTDVRSPHPHQHSLLRAGDHDQPNWHSVHAALRYVGGRPRLDEPFFVFRPDRDHDLVRGEGRERVSDRQFDVGFPSDSLHRLARKLLGRALGDALGLTEGALVVCKPIEDSLSNDRHHDLDPVCIADLGAETRFAMLNRADNQNASHARDPTPDRLDAKTTGTARE